MSRRRGVRDTTTTEVLRRLNGSPFVLVTLIPAAQPHVELQAAIVSLFLNTSLAPAGWKSVHPEGECQHRMVRCIFFGFWLSLEVCHLGFSCLVLFHTPYIAYCN